MIERVLEYCSPAIEGSLECLVCFAPENVGGYQAIRGECNGGIMKDTRVYLSLLDIAQRYDIAVIEDAAEAIGSAYHAKKAGSFGDAGVFSFHGSKTMTTGEGGMLVTDRQDIYDRVMFLRDHGRPPGDTTFHNTEVAYKYKMSAMQAALGLAQAERLDELTARKRQTFAWYQAGLDGLDGITLNVEPEGVLNSYWIVTIILDPRFDMDKHDFIARISGRNVDCRPFFQPLSSLPAYANTVEADRARDRNTVSYAISPYGVNLPSGMNLTEETVDYVCQQIKNLLGD